MQRNEVEYQSHIRRLMDLARRGVIAAFDFWFKVFLIPETGELDVPQIVRMLPYSLQGELLEFLRFYPTSEIGWKDLCDTRPESVSGQTWDENIDLSDKPYGEDREMVELVRKEIKRQVRESIVWTCQELIIREATNPEGLVAIVQGGGQWELERIRAINDAISAIGQDLRMSRMIESRLAGALVSLISVTRLRDVKISTSDDSSTGSSLGSSIRQMQELVLSLFPDSGTID